jgi:hypothetical protein
MALFRLLRERFRTFDLLPQYFTAAAERFQDILWGAGLPAIVWLIWSMVGTPPRWVNWVVVLCVLFTSGYYVWRADHVRLLPKFDIRDWHIEETPTVDGAGKPSGKSIYVQLLPKCLSGAEVEECQAYLLGVSALSKDSVWIPTAMNERVILGWSNVKDEEGFSNMTLHPGIEPRLNVFLVHSSNLQITPCANRWPLRAEKIFLAEAGTAFRFDIKVVARQCRDVNLQLETTLTSNPFNPSIVLKHVS